MQTPVFMILFLAPVYVPLHLLTGWIHAVARLIPMTAILTTARGLLAGHPTDVGVTLVVVAGLAAALALWSVRGLRRAEAAG